MNPRNCKGLQHAIWHNIADSSFCEHTDYLENMFKKLMKTVYYDEKKLPYYSLSNIGELEWDFICQRAVGEYPAFIVQDKKNSKIHGYDIRFVFKGKSKNFQKRYKEYCTLLELMKIPKYFNHPLRERFEELHEWFVNYKAPKQ